MVSYTARRTAPVTIYGSLVAFVGWGILGLMWLHAPDSRPLADLIFFILFSTAVKRLGFQVAWSQESEQAGQSVTHSLVGVVDLAALFSLGILDGGLVAALSAVLCRIVAFVQERQGPYRRMIWLCLFGSGLNAVMAFITGQAYRALGGAFPLRLTTWASLPTVLAVCFIWFALDHTGWALAKWLARGTRHALEFLRRIFFYSLFVELIPLPLSALITAAYLADSAPLLVLMVLTLVGMGYVLRRLMLALSEERKRTEQLLAISKVSRDVAAILDLKTLFARTVKLIQDAFGYYHVSIFTVDPERQRVIFQASSSPFIQQRGEELAWGEGIIGRVAMTGQSALVNDVHRDTRYVPDRDLAETHSEMAVPLKVEQRVLGILDIQADRLNAFTEQDLFVMETLASQIAIAIEDSNLYQAQQEQAWVSTALLQVAEAVAQMATPQEILQTMVRLTLMLTGVDRSVIFLWSEEKQAFIISESAGLAPEYRRALEGQNLTCEAIPLFERVRRGGQIVMGRSAELAHFLPPPWDGESGEGQLIALPLRIKGELIGIMTAEDLDGDARFAPYHRAILTGIANDVSLALENARLYQQTLQQERLQRELELARSIQQSFLPECCPLIPGWQLALEWHAARGVSGDYYDFIHLDPQRLGLLVADVSDKGMAAALYMALSRTVVRAVATTTRSPAEALLRVNRILLESSRSGMFVSMFYSILDLETGFLTYARAGHNPPLLIRAADRSIASLDAPGAILGVLEHPQIAEDSIRLAPGDVLVAYTDGVTESPNARQEEFGEERLRQVVARAPEYSAHDLVERVKDAVRAFTGEGAPFDDFTLLVLKRESAKST